MKRIDIPEDYLKEIKTILKTYAPDQLVLAYGSRVCGKAHEGSDLDLVIKNPLNPNQPQSCLAKLREAFRVSDLPISIEIHDWAALPDYFRREIEKCYVELK